MKDDAEIQQNVAMELKWSPDVDETDIAVKVSRGIATLTGFVHTYPEKFRAEAAVKRVGGVVAVANDIEVRLAAEDTVSDPEIAREAVDALKRVLPIGWENIKLLVRDGKVRLEGTVEWQYQREAAERAVGGLHGVVSIRSSILIQPKLEAGAIKRQIEEAFRRNAQVDADRVSVDVQGGEITLRGEVRSWAEHDQAQRTAWSAPGVMNVRNDIHIRT
jgi:osmotically-inducible protein OsmY